MFSVRRRILAALALALLLAPAADAQQQTPQPAPEAEDRFVSAKGFNNRVFEIKHRDPNNMVRVLAPLGSGFRGATMSANQEFKTITVRDFPENLAVIEEAIRRFDRPEPLRPGIEFHVHLLVASNDGAVGNRYPSELGETVRQLQSTLGYKNFSLMGSQVVRSRAGRVTNHNKGVADLKLTHDAAARNPVFYSYNFHTISLDAASSGPARVEIDDFILDMRIPLYTGPDKLVYENVGFKNPVSLREGERVVVGTTSVGDKSVIVILSVSTTK
jgi:hypothetical protein